MIRCRPAVRAMRYAVSGVRELAMGANVSTRVLLPNSATTPGSGSIFIRRCEGGWLLNSILKGYSVRLQTGLTAPDERVRAYDRKERGANLSGA